MLLKILILPQTLIVSLRLGRRTVCGKQNSVVSGSAIGTNQFSGEGLGTLYRKIRPLEMLVSAFPGKIHFGQYFQSLIKFQVSKERIL